MTSAQTGASEGATVVAVTGAFGCLGSTIAGAFARAGAVVCAIDAAPSPTGPLGQAFGPAGIAMAGVDVADEAQAAAAFDAIGARFGGIDALVNVAGGFRWERFDEGALGTWDTMYAMNLRTAVAASKGALPWLLKRDRGRIVNVSAGAALRGGIGMAAYSASKAGVLRLTESLAEELKDRRITVNAVLPSIIDTPRNREDMPDADFSRWVAPESIAALVLFLASDAAAAITGAGIPITGRC